MRTKKHYEELLDKNPSARVGFALAADAVYASRHSVIHRAEDRGSDEWKQIAMNLKRKYGDTLTVEETRAEMFAASGE